MKDIRKLLVANRGEIAIRVFRSAHELGIRTVAIFSHEDRYALHRFKADEAYQVGRVGEPIRAYLDIAGILEIARLNEVDAIHPGYGFLSENPELARACAAAGIIFIGPSVDALEQLGDKVAARKIAKQSGAPILAGSEEPLKNAKEAAKLAEKLGYPVLLKAAKGGGGRGMRVVPAAKDMTTALEQAQRESQTAFGSSDVFLEKYIQRPRHIEVQLLGDQHGNLIHLHERDCSVQRRHQKVVEIAPSVNLDPALRDAICNAAVQIGQQVGYYNAGTVEFLLDTDTGKFYFIEVNPRIQVEHTVTEVVTGVDIVRSQILIAQGYRLDDAEVGLPNQESIRVLGYAIQCRVTTEDPENKFMPDYGRITLYRSSGGMGIRLDAGTAFTGAVVTPYYDSLLVKVTAFGRRFEDAARRMERCLQEFRVRGVKTNIPFLLNLIVHPDFLAGKCTTRFIDETPELFTIAKRRDRATKLFNYLSEVIVNGHPSIKQKPARVRRAPAPVPHLPSDQPLPPGTRTRFLELGPEKFCRWILDQPQILLTDTTMRDAHQSLLATRLRTYDMLEIGEAYARLAPELFSLEMWGGATFDTALRFLKECPWQRLVDLRAKIPNILFQMLLRASNAVGYSNYPDNVVRAFVDEAAAAGIDLFRVFDSLNWVPNMRVAMEAVLQTGALCEAAICYTGDILDPRRTKYGLKYYVELAKELEKMGAHILAIKDMAGLCKPAAAERLIHALKQEIGVPIHFHTHDTAGIQASAIFQGAEVGLDIADGALAPMSGLTSQPNLNSIVEMFRYTERDSGLNAEHLDGLALYWEAVREYYAPFETGMMASTAEVYLHEMPGGQVTNLMEQAKAVGLGHRWADICRVYAQVNQTLGDIVKVTPSSKAVGDMAILLVSNNLAVEDILDPTREIAFPESFVDLISGKMGQPPGGFPQQVQEQVLRGEKPLTGRPGESLAPVDLKAAEKTVGELLGRSPTRREVLGHVMFPKVFREFVEHQEAYSDTSILPTPLFFYGCDSGQEAAVDIEQGKTLIMQFLTLGDPHPDGTRVAFFELNGQPRSVSVRDASLESELQTRPKADPLDPTHIAAPMPGMIVAVPVKVGDQVERGAKLVTLEAMKMETTLYAERAGIVRQINVERGARVETGDLLAKLE